MPAPIPPTSSLKPGQAFLGAQAELSRNLAARPYDFGFFQTLRRLDVNFGRLGFPRIGYALTRRGDPLHLGQRPFLVFAPRTLDCWSDEPIDECRLQPLDGERPFPRPVLLVYFLGLFGPNGPLPLHLTEHALERGQRHRDFAFINLANVLQHRFLSMFYRAWAAGRLEVDLDRPDPQRLVHLLGCLAGGPDALGRRFSSKLWAFQPPTPPAAAPRTGPLALKGCESWPRLYFSGHLISKSRHAEGLASILEKYFGIPTAVEPFVGRWLDLPPGSESRLGGEWSGQSLLGRTFILGSRVWDCQGGFRVRMGPMNLKALKRFLPAALDPGVQGADRQPPIDDPAARAAGQAGPETGQAGPETDEAGPEAEATLGARRLRRWVSEYAGPEFQWDLQLVLDKREVPPARLDGTVRLGLTTFLYAGTVPKDVDSIIFDLQLTASANRPPRPTPATH